MGYGFHGFEIDLDLQIKIPCILDVFDSPKKSMKSLKSMESI